MTSQKIAFLSGDEALAQGAYEAGLHTVASYPGTPATEITQYLAQFPEVDAQWSVNEKVAYEVAYGAAVAGKRALFAAKHVGLNVAMDGIMTSAYAGVNGGFVAVTADDPDLHSSQNEQDNRRIASFAKIPLIEPASPAEAKEFIKYALDLSEQCDIPVLFRITTRVAHTRENVSIAPRQNVAVKPFTVNIAKYVMVPAMAYKRHIDLEKRLVKLQQLAETSPLNVEEINDTSLGFITSGVSYLYIKEMYPKASVLKLGFSYPFPAEKVKAFAAKVKKLIVIEELEPILEDELKKLGLSFLAKDPSYRIGELRPEYIPDIIAGKKKIEVERTGRKPRLCEECPHAYVYEILAKQDVIVTGDIGCYSLGVMPPYMRMHTLICMGASVTFLESFSKTITDKKVVGVIGDSTFVHTGIPGLINAVYNKGKGLLLILDNSTTAMTGSQPHPGTGVTIKSEKTKRLDFVEICKACGVDTVDMITPKTMSELEQLISTRIDTSGIAVIIVKSACKLLRTPAKAIEAVRLTTEEVPVYE
jgi:indolepyruvate ferredoxin oxidoreductase alpha subunit